MESEPHQRKEIPDEEAESESPDAPAETGPLTPEAADTEGGDPDSHTHNAAYGDSFVS